jgi:hypothetical protein
MSFIITGTDSAGAVSLKRDSAAAAIKKAIELMGDGCREVCITDPDGRRDSRVRDQSHAASLSLVARSQREHCYGAADRGEDITCPPRRKLSR